MRAKVRRLDRAVIGYGLLMLSAKLGYDTNVAALVVDGMTKHFSVL
jgi:hypothetical protein